jgi:hypothetical protein
MRETYVLRRYGISVRELEQILNGQNDCCAICGVAWQQCVRAKKLVYDRHFLQHLCVDHDHATGFVRGLLCNACNAAIGYLQRMKVVCMQPRGTSRRGVRKIYRDDSLLTQCSYVEKVKRIPVSRPRRLQQRPSPNDRLSGAETQMIERAGIYE